MGRLERWLFSVMGPPELGEHRPPEGWASDPRADLCPRCGAAWDRHERVRTSSRGYAVCPPADG